jgi:hypothetical protein
MASETQPDPAPWRMSNEDAFRVKSLVNATRIPKDRLFGGDALDVAEALVALGIVPHPDQHGPEKCVPVSELRVEDCPDCAQRCVDGGCNVYPTAGVIHEGCDGQFCAHGICQECGSHNNDDAGDWCKYPQVIKASALAAPASPQVTEPEDARALADRLALALRRAESGAAMYDADQPDEEALDAILADLEILAAHIRRSAVSSREPGSPCPCGSSIWVDGKFRGPHLPKHVHFAAAPQAETASTGPLRLTDARCGNCEHCPEFRQAPENPDETSLAAAPEAPTTSFEDRLAVTEPIAKRLCADDGDPKGWPGVARILASALDDEAYRAMLAAVPAVGAERERGQVEISVAARYEGGPTCLFVNGYGVAQWPDGEAATERPEEYANEVARVLREALGAPAPTSAALDDETRKLLWKPPQGMSGEGYDRGWIDALAMVRAHFGVTLDDGLRAALAPRVAPEGRDSKPPLDQRAEAPEGKRNG